MRIRNSRRALTALGVSLPALALAALAAGAAQAQTAATAPVADSQEVIVTGFRGSLAKAINAKRNEDAAVDSILAEDIGKFPDLNLSESIQRIPGVALARDGGEGRQISVRGLGAQFTRVTINGMEALATAGGSDASGGTNRGRGFDFNVFASDLFNEITVRKTAEASQQEGSLGATVALRTARPFDYKGFTLAASAQASYNSLTEKTDPRTAFMIANQWDGGKMGILASIAYTKRNIIEDGFSTVRWAKGSAFSPGFGSVLGTDCTVTPAACTAANDALHPRFPRYDYYQNGEERLGGTLSFQFRPSENTLISIDGLYADFKVNREEYYLEAPSFSQAGACTTATRPNTCGIADTDITAMTITNGIMTKGTFDDVDLRVEDRVDHNDTKFTQLSVNLEHEFNNRFSMTGQIGVSKSVFDNPVQNTVIFDQFNVDNYSFDYSDARAPKFGFGTADLTNAAAWKLSQIRLRATSAKNDFATAGLDFDWKANDAFDIKFGADYRDYKFATTEYRRSNGSTANLESTIPTDVAATPTSQFMQLVSIGGTSFVTGDYRKASDLFNFPSQSADSAAWRLGPEPQTANNKSVEEVDSSGYVQASFRHDFGSISVRGNAGTRYVETKQTAQGYAIIGSALTPIVTERTYADWLPSANLVIEPVDNFLVRLSAARVMSRPDLTSLPAGASVNVSGANRSVSVGNPNLDPYRANAYDASFEWYFARGSLLSVALFQKEIDSFVQSVSTPGAVYTGNSFGLPDSLAIAACGTQPNCSPSLNNWSFSAPVNSPGGKLLGYEINYQQPFRFLPGFLSHTGVLINYTSVASRIKYLNASGGIAAINDLTGLSHESANATVYYEDSKWSARLSAAYRSKYLTRVPGSETGTDVEGTNATTNVDASIQYTLNRHLKLTLEGINLTDQYQDQYVDSRNLLSVYHHTGKEFLLGLRYTY